MRTFLLPSQAWHPRQVVWNQSTCDTFVSSFKFLRLLDLNGIGFNSVPHSIGKFKLLRYLNLLGKNYIKMLPNSITRLQNLETLNLSCCRGLIELPRNFTKLVNLRHLNIDGRWSLTHMPRGLGQLTNLQSLGVSREGFTCEILAKTSCLHPVLTLRIPIMCRGHASLRGMLTRELLTKTLQSLMP